MHDQQLPHSASDLPLLRSGESPAWWLSTCMRSVLCVIAKDYTSRQRFTTTTSTSHLLHGRAFAHGAIFSCRELRPEAQQEQCSGRMLEHKEDDHQPPELGIPVPSFHTPGPLRTDVVVAFGTRRSRFLVSRFRQFVNASSGQVV